MRRFIREIPIRIKDAIPDLFDRSIPPARLRAAVGIDSSRAHYLEVGVGVADAILGFAADVRGHWLDFGCGSGRIARHIADKVELTGVDIDRAAVAWCASHLRGDFRAIEPQIPLPFDAASFDVVYAVSVFTHLDEEPQFAWLAELRRVLKPGGKLIASTHPPLLTYNRPDMTHADHERLNATGFAFRAGVGGFNEDSAFHRPDYVLREWRRFFAAVDHHPGGLLGYQDVVVAVH